MSTAAAPASPATAPGRTAAAAAPPAGATWRAALVLLVVTLVGCLPRAGLADWMGTEGRRVQVVEEMVHGVPGAAGTAPMGGDWLVPSLGGEPTLAKPPLHYWLLAASAKVFGDGWLALRLPSILLVWAAATLAFALQRRVYGSGAAWIAGLGVACSPLVVTQFPTAEIDPPFACLVAMSLWLLAYGVGHGRRGVVLAAGLVGSLAVMAKGPVFFVFAAGAMLVWWRHRRGRFAGWFALALLSLPVAWLLALLSMRVSWETFVEWTSTETVGRLSTYQWKHVVELPGFLLRAFLVQMPLILWCFWEWRSTRDVRMGKEDLLLRMCSGGAVFAVFLLAIFPGKPTRYLLPNVPLFTFAVAPAVAHYARQCSALGRFATGALRVIGLLGAVGLVAFAFLPAPLPGRTPALLLVLALVPLIVRTPRALVAMCLWLPVAAAWTVQLDWLDRWEISKRARAPHGPLLVRELERLNGGPLQAGDVQTWGHFQSAVLLGAGILVPGHELAVKPPTARFVLREADRDPPLPELEGYEQRLRLCVPGEVLVVEARTGR